MRQRHVDRQMIPLLEGRLAGEERVRTLEHLEACPRCRKRWEDLRTSLEFLPWLPAVKMPAARAEGVRRTLRQRLQDRARARLEDRSADRGTAHRPRRRSGWRSLAWSWASRLRRAVSFFFLLLLVRAAAPLAAEPPSTVARSVAAHPRDVELAEIRQEISLLEAQLTTARNRESTLENELATTRIELRLQETQVREATAAFGVAESRALAAAAKVEELEMALVKVREDLKRRLQGLYRLGRQGYLRLFLALEPNRDLLPAIRQLRFLVRRDQVVLDRYLATREELRSERQRLEVERGEMEAWQQREQDRRDELVETRRRQERLLRKAAEERRLLAERTGALQEKERKLKALIDSLSGVVPLDGRPIQDFRGALDWPTRGRGEVVGRFGTRRDPRYLTEVPHNGIDIAFEGELDVSVAFPGEVLFAGPFEGYGQMVVIHHPGRVFTLYSGLAEIAVRKGDMVSFESVIGRAADQIYFEIRSENQPRDPLLWLR